MRDGCAANGASGKHPAHGSGHRAARRCRDQRKRCRGYGICGAYAVRKRRPLRRRAPCPHAAMEPALPPGHANRPVLAARCRRTPRIETRCPGTCPRGTQGLKRPCPLQCRFSATATAAKRSEVDKATSLESCTDQSATWRPTRCTRAPGPGPVRRGAPSQDCHTGLRRRAPASPAAPRPSRASDAGSGTLPDGALKLRVPANVAHGKFCAPAQSS